MGCLCNKGGAVNLNNDPDNLTTKKDEEEPVKGASEEKPEEKPEKSEEDPNKETTVTLQETVKEDKKLDGSNLDLSKASAKGKKKKSKVFD